MRGNHRFLKAPLLAAALLAVAHGSPYRLNGKPFTPDVHAFPPPADRLRSRNSEPLAAL